MYYNIILILFDWLGFLLLKQKLLPLQLHQFLLLLQNRCLLYDCKDEILVKGLRKFQKIKMYYDWIQGKPIVLRGVAQLKGEQLRLEEEQLHFQQIERWHHFQISRQFHLLQLRKEGELNFSCILKSVYI